MANSPGATVLVEKSAEKTTLAEKPADAGLWLAALPGRRPGPARPIVEPAEGSVCELPGAVTDLALSPDGRFLVAAHYGQDVVSVIDTATLILHAEASVAEPYALAVADRCYVNSPGLVEDTVVAVDTAAGLPLAGKEIDAAARGLAVSPSGKTLYVARCTEGGADIAVIDVESGHTASIPLADTPDAVVDVIRVSPDGSRIYAARTTAEGAALVVADARSHRVLHAVDVVGSLGDIAVHRDGRRVFATGWDAELGGVLTVIDTAAARVLDAIAMGGPATQVAVGSTRAYVISGERIVVVDLATMRVLDAIATDGAVSCIAVNGDGTMLYLGGYDATVSAHRIGGARLRAAS